MNKKFDSKLVYGDSGKHIKTKIKSYSDIVNTNFQDKRIPKKKNASYKCLPLIMLDSVVRVNKKHYPETFLEEFKDEIEKNKIQNLINADLDSRSSDESKFDNKSEKLSEKPSKKFDNDKSESVDFLMTNLEIKTVF